MTNDMKARVIATGKIIGVKEEYDLREAMPQVFYSNEEDPYEVYEKEELDFDIEGKFAENCLSGIKQGIVHDPDYWTRLEHQYAGMAMQGFLASGLENTYEKIADYSIKQAHALVEKMKEEGK